VVMGVPLSKAYRRQRVGRATKGCASHITPDGKHCHPVPMTLVSGQYAVAGGFGLIWMEYVRRRYLY